VKHAHGNQYWAYGQGINSELVIPEFVERTDIERADVDIRLESEQKPPKNFEDRGWFFEVTRARALMYFSGVAVFYLAHGKSINIVPVPGADYRLIALYLSGTVFSVLLYQQGLLVVHASAVAMPQTGEAVLFMGESGAGKSSLAAAMMQRGFQVLCDDVSALFVPDAEKVVSVTSAFPFLKVDKKTLEMLRFNLDECREVHDVEPKMFLPCQDNDSSERYPVRAFVHLCPGKSGYYKRLSARQAMIELVRYSVPTRLLHTVGDVQHFKQCGSVASRVACWSLQQSDAQRNSLDKLASQVEEMIAAS